MWTVRALQGLERVPELIAAVKIPLPFNLNEDSSYQNTTEFMAVVMGLGCLASLGFHGAGVRVKGDNRSSLSWSTSERFRSKNCGACAIHFMAIATHWDLVVVEGIHVEGVRNIVCDGLSREVSLADSGFFGRQVLDWEESPSLIALLRACDPSTEYTSKAIVDMWRGSVELVSSL